MQLRDIKEALNILELPSMITKDDIKKQYRFLVKKNHPDRGGDLIKLQELNAAYDLLMEYVNNYKFSFDESEISKQLPFKLHFDNFKM
ncbi:MAG: J domain-containing protein [Arcobacter sp.]|nr:J domain-containing protein [Campylobacterota bacterium]MBD3831637.1 J domain-containing protein [Arcobacter sp.]